MMVVSRRFEAEVRALKSIPKSMGGLVRDFDRVKFQLEVLPGPDLNLSKKQIFDVCLPRDYPLRPPSVKCADDDVKMSLLDEWSRAYDTTVVFYALRRLFLKRGALATKDEIPVPKVGELSFEFSFDISEASTVGRRKDMEDVTTIDESRGLACVFDGHGGRACAQWAGERVPRRVFSELARTSDRRQAIWQALVDSDKEWSTHPGKDNSGCTAIVVYFEQPYIYVANLGDCRCVLARFENNKLVAHDLSLDARADRPDEIARICEAGGFVANRRVNGQLAVSRALGDLAYKRYDQKSCDNVVSCEPDVVQVPVEQGDEFLVAACDGLWDVLSSQAVVDFVRDAIKNHDLQTVAENLVKHAVDDKKSTDNVSVVVVRLLHQSREQQAAAAAEPALSTRNNNTKSTTIKKPRPSFGFTSARTMVAPRGRKTLLENDDDLFEYLLDDRNFFSKGAS